MMQTIEQRRARHALSAVDTAIASHGTDSVWLREMRQCAQGAPATVLSLGLGTTVTMLAKERVGTPQRHILASCTAWLLVESGILRGQEDLLAALTTSEQRVYFLAQSEAERLLGWIKKLAVARIDSEGGLTGAGKVNVSPAAGVAGA